MIGKKSLYKNVKYIGDVCSIQHTYLIENSLMCMMLFPVTIAQIIHMQGIKVCVIMIHLLPSKEIIVQLGCFLKQNYDVSLFICTCK